MLTRMIFPRVFGANLEFTEELGRYEHSGRVTARQEPVDIKVAQEILRHALANITLDLYTQAISSQKREAGANVVKMLFPDRVQTAPEHTYTFFEFHTSFGRRLQAKMGGLDEVKYLKIGEVEIYW
jgi:hypothetical protein